MIVLNNLSVIESVHCQHSIVGGFVPKVIGSVKGLVIAGVSGQVRGTVSVRGSSATASYAAAGGGAGGAAGVIDVNPSLAIIIGVGFSI